LIETILCLDEEIQLELQTIIERSFNLAGGAEEQQAYQSQIEIMSTGGSPNMTPEKG
jgi:hypothetical protein